MGRSASEKLLLTCTGLDQAVHWVWGREEIEKGGQGTKVNCLGLFLQLSICFPCLSKLLHIIVTDVHYLWCTLRFRVHVATVQDF